MDSASYKTTKAGQEHKAKLATAQEERLALIEANQAVWVKVEGVNVLRVNDSRWVAVPANGKKNSKTFDIVNLETREVGCALDKKEVYGWLFRNWENEAA